MFKHDPTDTKPCSHMRVWVSALADGALTGIPRWYTERHIAGCPQCQKGLTTIHTMRDRLQTVHETVAEDVLLSQERWASVELNWERIEQARSQPAP